MNEEKVIRVEPVEITLPLELTEFGAQWLAGVLGGRVRTFRHPDGKYEHTVSVVDPDWPEEIEADDSPSLD